MIEEWRPIQQHPKYEVSSLGRIRFRIDHETTRPVKGSVMKIGYPAISIKCPVRKINKLLTVHRLVMAAFHGPSTKFVNHKNGVKIDNCIENLEYCTQKENNQHAFKTKLIRSWQERGLVPPRSILNEKKVIEIRSLLLDGATVKDVAKVFSVHYQTIYAIKVGRTWKHKE